MGEACVNKAVFIKTGCSLPPSVLDADGHLWSKCELDSELGLSWKRPYKPRPSGPEAQAGPIHSALQPDGRVRRGPCKSVNWDKGKNTSIRDVSEIWLTDLLKPRSKCIHLSHIWTDMDSMPGISPANTSGCVRSPRKQIYENKAKKGHQ